MTIVEPWPWPAIDIGRIWGEEACASVQPQTACKANEAGLIAHVAQGLAPYKASVRIDARTDEFPRNASGKSLKPQLRQAFLSKLATN